MNHITNKITYKSTIDKIWILINIPVLWPNFKYFPKNPFCQVRCCFTCKDMEKVDTNLDYGTYYYGDSDEKRTDVMEVSNVSFSFSLKLSIFKLLLNRFTHITTKIVNSFIHISKDSNVRWATRIPSMAFRWRVKFCLWIFMKSIRNACLRTFL